MHDPNQSRVVRVFISSTFRDMQAERDYLVKFTFPQLRKLCESRGVTWGEVDLRWGITDEETAEGKVLPLCLEEIHRCRPYFIGLLGQRYGWIPDHLPPEVIEREAWLREHVDERKSVTELEILHGVLNSPQMANHAFFYFRDSKYVEQLPTEQRSGFITEDTESAKKLEVLKERIRESGFPVREDYADPRALGELVLKDLTELIESLYPAGEEPDPVDREAADQEAFAQSRTRIYIRRQEYFDRLDEHVQSNDPPLVVLGESGSGKSALLANWFLRYRERCPEYSNVIHFIGSTPDSADPLRLLRRIMLELKRRFPDQLGDDVPTQPEKVREEFSRWLARAAASGKLVLIIDGLNQLEDRAAAIDLGWLPRVFPTNCRMILSTLPGRSLDAIRRRHWPELTVQPLTMQERQELIEGFLAQYSRRLSAARVKRIASAEQTANPLFLRAMLDELRQLGEHERLGERIDHYLGARDPKELYERILERWKLDYGQDLVRQSLRLIWAARRGLSEAELLDLLGKDMQPLPRAKWTPFFLASEAGFTIRAGLLTFSHSYLRAAVETKCFTSAEDQRVAHERLAVYFEFAPLPVQVRAGGSSYMDIYLDEQAAITSRALDELPWQLQAAGQWEFLADHLSFLPVFRAACASGRELEWMQYWQQVLIAAQEGMTPQVDIPSLYLSAFRELSPDKKGLLGGMLGQFLRELGFLEAARECFQEEAAVGARLFSEERFFRAANLNDQGLILMEQGDNLGALEFFNRAVDLLQTGVSTKGERRALASLLMGKANVLSALGKSSESLPLLQRALELMKETEGERSPEVATVMQTLGNVFGANEDLERALFWQREAYSVRRENFGKDHRDVGLSLGNLANPLVGLGRIHCAMRLRERALQILQQTYGVEHHLTRTAAKGLVELKKAADQAMVNESSFGSILLVFESLPPEECPPDPTTDEGVRLIARAISDSLTSAWDEMVMHGSSIPVLLVSCPGFEDAVSLALDQPIAKMYPTRLLRWIQIPGIEGDSEDPAAFAPLVKVRQDFLTWLEKHSIKVLMVKPVSNIGTELDRAVLNFMARDQSPKLTTWSRVWRSVTNLPTEDRQPLAVEVVPFDNLEGPITGLYTGERDPRPYIMPALAWKQQRYSPQPKDQRATGAFYLNLPAARRSLSNDPETGLTPLDKWSMNPLMSLATKARPEQLAVFETALSELMLVVKASLLSCPAERGLRGFETAKLDDEVEDWLS